MNASPPATTLLANAPPSSFTPCSAASFDPCLFSLLSLSSTSEPSLLLEVDFFFLLSRSRSSSESESDDSSDEEACFRRDFLEEYLDLDLDDLCLDERRRFRSSSESESESSEVDEERRFLEDFFDLNFLSPEGDLQTRKY
jgi:hypothetical protein